jgi:hypothetical protein
MEDKGLLSNSQRERKIMKRRIIRKMMSWIR